MLSTWLFSLIALSAFANSELQNDPIKTSEISDSSTPNSNSDSIPNEQSSTSECVPAEPKCYNYPSIFEFKAGYFFFSDSTMRKVYNDGGLDLQLTGSGSVYRWLHLYGSVEYLERSGKSLGGGYKTSIWEIPLSLGLKPVISITDTFQFYFTLGPRYVFMHLHNQSPYVDRNLSDSGFAGFANVGFNFFPTSYLSIDVFGEYSYFKIKVDPDRENVFANRKQIGGFVFGAGLGYAF